MATRLLKCICVLGLLFAFAEETKVMKGKVLRRRFEYPDQDLDKYYLVTDDDQELPLNDNATTVLKDVSTGTEVSLDPASGNPVALSQEPSPASSPELQMTSILFPLNICNQKTTTDIKAYLELAEFMKQYFASCSIRAVHFSQHVVAPIDLPCNSTTYAQGACNDREIVGWARYAETYATNELGIDLKKFTYRMFVIPFTSPCPWLGLADVGCIGGCRSWIKGGPEGYSLLAAFHELGHNMGLRHSQGPDGDEYGDYTSAMGGCCSLRCHNAPQAWSIGWYDPVEAMANATDTRTRIVLPAMLSKRKNFVNIRDVFLSYRTRIGYDADLSLASNGSVHVHSFNGSQSMKYAKSRLLHVMARGGSFKGVDWIANVTDINGTHAVLSVCKVPCKDPCAGSCGNGVCEPFAGETCKTCPQDCMEGVTKYGPFCCGAEGQCRFHWRCTTRKVSCKATCT